MTDICVKKKKKKKKKAITFTLLVLHFRDPKIDGLISATLLDGLLEHESSEG